MSHKGQGLGDPNDGEVSDVPDPKAWEVRYDLWQWSRQERLSLSSELAKGGVEFRWEATELVVSPDDEDYVDGLVGLAGEEDGDKSDDGGPANPTASDHVMGVLGNLLEVALDAIVGAIPI